jgi:hypothetical protein
MSYQQRVLRDNPVGFWALDSASPAQDSSTGTFISGTRTTNNATIGSTVVTSGISPLVCGGDAAAVLVSSSVDSKITIDNSYNVFYKGAESKDFSIEFWMSLEQLGNESGEYKCSLLSIPNILQLDIVDNIVTLAVNDPITSSMKYAYVEVESFDPQLHFMISYKDKGFSLGVNGDNLSSVQMDRRYYFNASHSSPPDFIFSCNAYASTARVIIDSIAMYNYKLDLLQIKNHMIWALTDKAAHSWTSTNSGGYVDPKDQNTVQENYYMFNTDEEWKTGKFKNCYSEKGFLTARYIPPMSQYSTINAPSISLSALNGLQVGNTDSSLVWDNFNNYMIPGSDTLTISVKPDNVGSFFSLSGFGFGQLSLRYTADDGGTLELYSPETPAITLKETGVSTGSWKTVLIYFTGNIVNMQVGTGTVRSYDIGSPISVTKLTMYLGNTYTTVDGVITTNPMVGGLKNLIITPSGGGWIKAELLSNYKISQYSEWTAQLTPKSTGNIIGSRMHHGTSSRNIELYTSLDSTTWVKLEENANQIPAISLNQPQPVIYTKVVINTPDSSVNKPTLDFLELITYRSMYMDARGFHFSVTPYSSNNKHSYIVRPNEYNVLSRDTNIGIYFQSATGSNVPGRAIVTTSDSKTYEAIEFWFKVHSDPSVSESYIMHCDSTLDCGLYYDADLKLNLSGAGWNVGYLNGEVISGTPTLIVDEIYHFVGTLDAASNAVISLNGKYDDTKHGNVSFGYIAEYATNPFTSVDIVREQRKRFLGINQYVQTDSQSITLSDTPLVISAQWSVVPAAIV